MDALPQKGSYLCTLQLMRHADGTIHASVADMPPALIDTTGEEVPGRIGIIADWAEEGVRRMREAWQ